MTKAHPEIFVREPKNPILTAAMWPLPFKDIRSQAGSLT
jgi:hypothetical protein